MARRSLLATLIAPVALLAASGGPVQAVFSAGPAAPQVVWTVEAPPGYSEVRLGPSGRGNIALVFIDPGTATTPDRVRLRAVAASSGVTVWNVNLRLRDVDSIGANRYQLYEFSSRRGQLTGRAWISGWPLWAAPAASGVVADDGLVVWLPAAGRVAAADPHTGRTVWQHDFPERDNWTLGTLARGKVYLLARGDSAVSGCSGVAVALDGATGAVRRQAVFDPDMGCQYVFSYLRWSPDARILYAQDGVEGAGVHGRAVFVMDQDLAARWTRADIRDCAAVEALLVCEAYGRTTGGAWVQHGPVAVTAATGRTVWQDRVADAPLGAERVVGARHGAVIVVHRPQDGSGGSVRALRTADGTTLWTLAVPAQAAAISGDILLAAVQAAGQPARVVAYGAP